MDGPSLPKRVSAFLGVEAFSAIGSWATIVAIWGYAAFEFNADAGEVSMFGLAFAVPPIILGPVTGVVIDRYGPKATLAFAKIVGIVGSLALLSATTYRQFVVLTLFHGVSAAFAMPALQSLPPRLVEDRHLARTNALVSLTDEIAIVLGPVAAGLSIGAFGFRGAFIFDALTYGAGLVALPLVQLRAVRIDESAEPPTSIRAALEGFRLVARTPILRRTVGLVSSVHFLYGAAFLIEPLYVRDVLERSPQVFAALQTAFGVCLVAAALVVARMGERLASIRWVVSGVVMSGITMGVYLGTNSMVIAFGGVAVWGGVTALISGPSRTVIQRNAPESAHGRVLATDFVTQSFATLIGIVLAGLLVDAFDVPRSAIGLGATVVVVGLLLGAGTRENGGADTATLAAPGAVLADASASDADTR